MDTPDEGIAPAHETIAAQLSLHMRPTRRHRLYAACGIEVSCVVGNGLREVL